jgi:hypothetical protein
VTYDVLRTNRAKSAVVTVVASMLNASTVTG